MNCVLLGYGTVGRQVEALCKKSADLNLQHVYVRPEKADEPYFTNRGEQIVSAPETDLVFECMNGLEPANTLIRTALKAGKHVVSSNKAVLSQNLEDYVRLANENGGTLQIEASAGGGIPILDAILKLSRAEELTGFEGILNGTSNYILDSMEKEGTSFEDVLQKAIDLGYAEADPTSDIEGIDVWYKSLLVASLLTDSPIAGLPRPFGISNISAKDIALAKKLGRKIRHVSILKNESGKHSSVIAPLWVKADDFFGSVSANYNGQLVFGDSFGSLGYYGQGAGGLATAQAMIANALDAADDRIRPIVLDQASAFDEDLLKEDWIVRTVLDPKALACLGLEDGDCAFFEEDGYYLFPGKTQSEIRKILDQDAKAMIGVWKA